MVNLWHVYEKAIPDFISEMALCPEMQRLKDVGMNCGCEYTNFPRFVNIAPYSRFEHSMGGADRIYDNSETCCRIEDGKLLMQVHRTDDPEHPYRLPEGFTTKDRMLFRYGYLEMRAKLPYRHGAWPSFWMKSHTSYSTVSWFSEIDILEIFSSPHSAVCNLHKWGKKADGTWGHCSYDGVEGAPERAYVFQNHENLNDEYHVYGFEWDEQKLTFYVDDVPYKSFSIDAENGNIGADVIDGVEGFHDFHFVLMNNEIFTPRGGWVVPGWTLTEEDPFPIEYRIDWVRLYQDPKKEGLHLTAEIAQKKQELEAKA